MLNDSRSTFWKFSSFLAKAGEIGSRPSASEMPKHPRYLNVLRVWSQRSLGQVAVDCSGPGNSGAVLLVCQSSVLLRLPSFHWSIEAMKWA